MSILQENEDGSGYYFILEIRDWRVSFYVSAAVYLRLQKNAVDVGVEIPHNLIMNLFSSGEVYIKNMNNNVPDVEVPLIREARDGKTNNVKKIIREGADIKRYGNTALMVAAYNGHEETVKLLIEEVEDINAKSIFGVTALECAVKRHHGDIIDLLIEKGAHPSLFYD
jgi:ankyrin repeat protein